MQIIHDFDVSPWQYYLNGQDNDFPAQNTCPHCHDEMIGHGFYQRYIITETNRSYQLHTYLEKFMDNLVEIMGFFQDKTNSL